ncbi:MAG: ABC transporter substrate binding protein [Nanoarchaeota archaeon]|nr:ABC transporter substrate binding protein [Nanoarchaeota archaeon]
MKIQNIIQITLALILVSFIIAGCGITVETDQAIDEDIESKDSLYGGKKIIFINSYHEGFEWSDREQAAAEAVLKDTGVELKVIYMDTKNNPSEEFKTAAGIKAKDEIEAFKPDLIITVDDNAFKYVIMPFYKDSDIPVVFGGINGDSSVYGTPYTNTAGIEESPLVGKMVENLLIYAKGTRAGYLSQDVLSEQQNIEFYSKSIEGGIAEVALVANGVEWQEKFLELQDKVDFLIIGACGNLAEWEPEETKQFVLQNSKIPSITQGDYMMDYSLMGMVLVPEEHGEWTANTALEILGGKKPNDIPVVINKQGRLFLNARIANELGIVFLPEQIKNAQKIYD